MDKVIVCNFNCICYKADCNKKFYHAIPDIEERKLFRDNVYSLINIKDYNETDPDGVRKVPCKNGHLCKFPKCNFKHFINVEGRILLSKKWMQEKKKLKVYKLISDLETDLISKEDAAKVLKDIWGITGTEKKEEKEDKEE